VAKGTIDKLGEKMAALKGRGFEQKQDFEKKVGDYCIAVRESEETTYPKKGKPKHYDAWRVDLNREYGRVGCCAPGADGKPEESVYMTATFLDQGKAVAFAGMLGDFLAEHGFAKGGEKDEGEDEKA